MPRTNRLREKREELLPVVARAFTQLGYRRATTRQLAERCGVQENILYRLWRDKKTMFIAAIDYVYQFSEGVWLTLLAKGDSRGRATQRLLEFESTHQGEFGHYRIIFTGLAEADDPDIHAALRRMFQRFQRFLEAQIVAHGRAGDRRDAASAALSAWALVGLGTVANIGRELGLLDKNDRAKLLRNIGGALLRGDTI